MRSPIRWHKAVEPLLIPASHVKPHPSNPNNGDEDVVRESILINGVYRPIFVNRKTKLIVGGHTQYAVEVAMQLEAGIDEPVVPVLWVDGGAAEAKRILAVDNGAAAKAVMDDGQLYVLLRELDDDAGLAGSGYDADDLAKLAALADVDDALHGDALQLAELEPFSRYDADSVIEAAIEHYRRVGFPYRDLPLHVQMQQLNKLASTPTDKLMNNDLAYHVADSYHPHRFAVPIPGKHTPLSSFEHDGRLRIAMRMVLDEGGEITDNQLLSALGMVRNSQAAANFRPAFALLMYRRFADDGAVVLDTSTGFGGRLLGFAASRCSKYVGIDPNVPTHVANEHMARQLRIADRVQLINQPAEDVDARKLRGRCDFAFTSPPYFSKERYSDDDTQSWVRYDSGDAWRVGFLRAMLRLQHVALARGSYNVVNIADVKIGSETYPLVDWTIDEAQRVGFDVETVERFPIARVPGSGNAAQRFEPVIVMRKP